MRQKDEDLSGLSRQLDLVESAMCLTLRHSVLSQQTGQTTLIKWTTVLWFNAI